MVLFVSHVVERSRVVKEDSPEGVSFTFVSMEKWDCLRARSSVNFRIFNFRYVRSGKDVTGVPSYFCSGYFLLW